MAVGMEGGAYLAYRAELVRPCRDAGAEREGGLKIVHDGNAPRNFAATHAKYHGTMVEFLDV